MDDVELDRLREDVDRLQQGQDFYGDDERDQLRLEIRDLAARMADLEAHIAELEQKIDRTQRRTAKAVGLTAADLDDVDPETRRLAQVAEPLPDLRAGLLDEPELAKLRGSLALVESWRERHHTAVSAALDLSKDLSTSSLADAAHPVKAGAFRREYDVVHRLAAQKGQMLATERKTLDRLHADEAERAARAPRIDAARDAARTLRERLHTTLSTAVIEDQLLPKWLEDTLGLPPAEPYHWLGWATEIVAYRITYAVTDPLHPLGDPDAAARLPRRQRWHRGLAMASDYRDLFTEPDWL